MGCCGNCEEEELRFEDRKPGSLRTVNPPNFGWLEYKLHDDQIEFIWDCIDKKGSSYKNSLVGDIDNSFSLKDVEGRFKHSVLFPLIDSYRKKYGNYYDGGRPLVGMEFDWWVNYQKEGQYNPLHYHSGAYSFVIWMKIPTESDEQNLDSPSGTRSNFYFNYINATGGIEKYEYRMSKKLEGCMLLFPSALNHIVYPFYNCSEDRVSVSGNVVF